MTRHAMPIGDRGNVARKRHVRRLRPRRRTAATPIALSNSTLHAGEQQGEIRPEYLQGRPIDGMAGCLRSVNSDKSEFWEKLINSRQIMKILLFRTDPHGYSRTSSVTESVWDDRLSLIRNTNLGNATAMPSTVRFERWTWKSQPNAGRWSQSWRSTLLKKCQHGFRITPILGVVRKLVLALFFVGTCRFGFSETGIFVFFF